MGMTIKQAALEEFHEASVAYKQALESGDSRAIIGASLRIHCAKGNVPKVYRPQVGRIYRETVVPPTRTGLTNETI